MDIESWWPNLSPDMQQWLIDHVGEPMPTEVVVAITQAGGVVASEAWWVSNEAGSSGFYVSDAAAEWIEELGA